MRVGLALRGLRGWSGAGSEWGGSGVLGILVGLWSGVKGRVGLGIAGRGFVD